MSDTEQEIQEIIGERSSKKGVQYLVRWKNFGPEDNSWEPLTNLTNAVQAIADFHKKTMALVTQQKKTSRKSKSRSRSRSRSRSTSRTRGKKRASPARKTTTSPGRKSTRTTTTVKTPAVEETKTEVVTNSPGRFEKTSETVTKTVYSPETHQTRHVSRVSEFTSTTSSSKSSSLSASQEPAKGCSWMNVCCAPVRKVQDCFRGCMRTDYPAIVVIGTISIILLSFLLEKNVDFEKLWSTITGFFIGIYTWLTTLVQTK